MDESIGGAASKKSIKVYNIDVPKTAAEKNADFERWKQASKEPAWLWTAWNNILRRPFRTVQPSNIVSIQIKNLLDYALAVSDGNPHLVGKRAERPDDMWLQYDHDLKVIDKSSKEYRVPRDVKFRIIGLHLWWRQHSNVAPRSATFRTMLELGQSADDLATEVSILQNRSYVGARRTPLPFPPDYRVELSADAHAFDQYYQEIAWFTTWYQKNESMLYLDLAKKYVVDAAIAWPAVVPTKDKLAQRISALVDARFNAATDIADIAQMDLLDLWHKIRLLPVTSPIVKYEFDRLKTRWENMSQSRAHRFANQTIVLEKTIRDSAANELHPGLKWIDLTAKDRALAQTRIDRRRAVKTDPNLRRTLARIRAALDSTVTDTFAIRRILADISASSSEICPHYTFLLTETLKAHKNALGQIDVQTILQSGVQKFSGNADINFNYYCSKCGELLMTEDLDEYLSFKQNIVSSTQDKDPIWAYILSECNQVIRRVKFAKPQMLRPFVIAIATTLEPEILSQQAEMQRSKTKSLEDIRTIITVIINVYCFALVSKLIIDHPAKLRWNVATTGGRVQKQTEVAKVLNIAYTLALDNNQNRIGKIKDFTTDQIKPILLRAYEWAKNVKFAREESDDTNVADVYATLMHDPWYNLIYEMASSQSKVDPMDFKRLFGAANPTDALCSARPFEHAFRPRGKTTREQNYLCLLDYIDSGIYREFAIPSSPMLIAWWNKYRPLQEQNDQEKWARQLRPTRPSVYYGQVPTFKHLDISLIRCPTGERHSFTVLKYRHGKKVITYKYGEFRGRPEGTLDDITCVNCGRSKYAKPDPKVSGQIANSIEKNNFFQYFKNRCPAKNDIHDFPVDKLGFVGDAECRACGYRPSYFTVRPDAWRNKWRHAKMGDRPAPRAIERGRVASSTRVKLEKWSVTLTSIMQIANVSATPYNIWINLGLSEQRNFNAIRQGKINPQSTMDDAAAAVRLVKLINWVRWIQRQYMAVRNHSRISISPALKSILDVETNFSAKNMPDILMDFSTKLEALREQNARVVCNFVLHTICSTLLQIRALPGIKKLAGALFDYLVEQIVQGETAMSKLEIAKMQTVAAADDVPEMDDDEYLERQEEQDVMDRGTEDPFSLDGADIETDNTGREDDEYMD